MEKNKKKTIIIVILTILLLVAIAGICYQTIKYQDLNEKYTNIAKENNENKQKLEQSTTQKPDDNVTSQYEKFLENAKKSRETKFNEYSSQTLEMASRVLNDANYRFEIKSNGDLIMNVYGEYGASVKNAEKYKNYKIDTNVLLMEMSDSGNGGYKHLWYLKEDGNVYVISPDNSIVNKKEIEIKKENYQHIVSIEPASFGDSVGGGGWAPIFIDIEGNIHSSN